jgi:hypothetical protein
MKKMTMTSSLSVAAVFYHCHYQHLERLLFHVTFEVPLLGLSSLLQQQQQVSYRSMLISVSDMRPVLDTGRYCS